MFDHLKRSEEERMGGTPEGVPQLASLAGQAGWGSQLPPPPGGESEAPALQPEGGPVQLLFGIWLGWNVNRRIGGLSGKLR